MANRSRDQLLCLWGAPLPPYIKEQGGRGGRPGGGAPGGVLLPPGVGLPPFPCWIRRRGKVEEEEKKERGAPPPLLVQFGLEGEGARGLPWPPLLFSTKAHIGPLIPRGGSGNPRYSDIYPINTGTIPVSEYSCPIYQSSCFDHFETPCHVRDHIRAPNKLWYIKIYKLIIKLSA